MFGIWQIFAVVALFCIAVILGLVVISAGEVDYRGVYKTIPIIFLYCAILYGITTLNLWMGLKGLKLNSKSDGISKAEKT